MNQKFKVGKPCSESWSEMLPEEKGKFCEKCAKSVIDFTKSSDQEIEYYLNQNGQKEVCGRMFKPKTTRVIHKAAVGLALVSLTLPNFAFDWDPSQNAAVFATEMVQNSFGIVQGIISDEKTGETLPFVNVSTTLNGQLYGCVSDFDGNYKLQIPTTKNSKDSITLTFSYLGYETIERVMVVRENQISSLNINLTNQQDLITIGVIVREPILEKNANPFETKIEQPFRRNKNKRN